MKDFIINILFYKIDFLYVLILLIYVIGLNRGKRW